MTKHYWYVIDWVQREQTAYDPDKNVWLPKKLDVVAPSMKEAGHVFKNHYLETKAEVLHVSIKKIGTERDYLENQGQLTIEWEGLDGGRQ